MSFVVAGLGMLINSLSSLAPIIGFGVWKGMLLRSQNSLLKTLCSNSLLKTLCSKPFAQNSLLKTLCSKLFAQNCFLHETSTIAVQAMASSSHKDKLSLEKLQTKRERAFFCKVIPVLIIDLKLSRFLL